MSILKKKLLRSKSKLCVQRRSARAAATTPHVRAAGLPAVGWKSPLWHSGGAAAGAATAALRAAELGAQCSVVIVKIW